MCVDYACTPILFTDKSAEDISYSTVRVHISDGHPAKRVVNQIVLKYVSNETKLSPQIIHTLVEDIPKNENINFVNSYTEHFLKLNIF